jgi:uncharacterized protein YecE (DUF72 family)
LWQFAPTKRFDPDDFAAFLAFLPDNQNGVPLAHAVEVRHESFACKEFVDLARRHSVAVVIADHAEYPQIADLTADFVYARIQKSREEEPLGYRAGQLDEWTRIAKSWAAGHAPEGLSYVAGKDSARASRDVYLLMISGAKVRNPAAAMALMERL